jgi:hypothetical protein
MADFVGPHWGTATGRMPTKAAITCDVRIEGM